MRVLIGAGKPSYAKVLAQGTLLAWFAINEAWTFV